MTKFCECVSEHVIPIKTRNTTICVITNFLGEYCVSCYSFLSLSLERNPRNASQFLCPIPLF